LNTLQLKKKPFAFSFLQKRIWFSAIPCFLKSILAAFTATSISAHMLAALRVNKDRGLFHFDNSYRPCPLDQQYIGINVKKPLQRFQLMNEVCYEKVVDCAGKHQVGTAQATTLSTCS
jgi:hypothetical protein